MNEIKELYKSSGFTAKLGVSVHTLISYCKGRTTASPQRIKRAKQIEEGIKKL